MIGGMSWQSTIEYYRLVNESIQEKLGGLHSAKCVLYSVDFAEIEELQRHGEWNKAAEALVGAAQGLEKAGTDFVLICTNTMHKLADAVQASIGIPLLHIADATAEAVRRAGLRRVGLLGTRFTMEEEFYRGRLANRFGLEVVVPDAEDRQTVHRIIYEELCAGAVRSGSKALVSGIINRLETLGARGVILGCTELGLLVDAGDSPLPLFDTTRLHARAAVDWAMS